MFIKKIIKENSINSNEEYYEKYLKIQVEDYQANKDKFFFYSDRYERSFCEKFAPKTLATYIIQEKIFLDE